MNNRQTQIAEFIETVNTIPERDKLLSGNTGDEGSRFLHKSTKRDNSITKVILRAELIQKASSHFTLQSGQPSSQNLGLPNTHGRKS